MNQVFKVADIRSLDRKYQNDEISYSRMVELMNEMAHNHYVVNNNCNLHIVIKAERTLPLREFIEAVDEYVKDQENDEITRTPSKMSTIKAVTYWCKRFAEHLAK